MTDAERTSASSLVDDPVLRRNTNLDEVVDSFIRRIEDVDGRVGAFWNPTFDLARRDARTAPEGPLRGTVIAVKDNIDVADEIRTAGSAWFADFRANQDAGVVRRLRSAGAVVIGKTAMAELGLGATSDNEEFGRTNNPWNLDHTAGGSSGGSAAAIAADMCTAALGTDTGGSVRVPAHFCGVTALRPSRGGVDTTGVVPVANSLDTVGPMARSARDVAQLFSVLSEKGSPSAQLGQPERLRMGISDGGYSCHPAIAAGMRNARSTFEGIGIRFTEIDIPGIEQTARECLRLTNVEASIAYYETVLSHPEKFGSETRRRLEAPDASLHAERAVLLQRASRWRQEVEEVFEAVDFLLLPVAAMPAPRSIDAPKYLMAELGPFTHPWSLAGVPALSIPAGFTDDGLPVAIQLIAANGSDRRLLELGELFQETTDWHVRRPPGLTTES